MAAVKAFRILAVEDNPDTLTLLRYMLSANYDPVLAMEVDQALAIAQEETIDLFLLDINLGENRTGIDLLHILRSYPQYQTTPALALTAYAMPGDRERFLQAGFDGYISKPFTRQSLIDAITEALVDHTSE